MTNSERAHDLYKLIGQGQLMEGFEKYYAENVVMQEVGEDERVGKEINRAYEQKFLESVEEWHGMTVDAVAEDPTNNKVLIETSFDATFKGAGRMQMGQVCVQTWQDGQIVKELFYHK
jgi:hypothetical protein